MSPVWATSLLLWLSYNSYGLADMQVVPQHGCVQGLVMTAAGMLVCRVGPSMAGCEAWLQSLQAHSQLGTTLVWLGPAVSLAEVLVCCCPPQSRSSWGWCQYQPRLPTVVADRGHLGGVLQGGVGVLGEVNLQGNISAR